MKINPETGRPIIDDEGKQRRDRFINGLRDLANWYESRPDLPAPNCPVDACFVPNDKQSLAALTRAAGSLEKVGDKGSDYFDMKKQFGDRVLFRILVDKERTCERVKVGTETIPAVPAHTLEVPAKPETVVDKFEWRCPESILAEGRYAESINAAVPNVEFPQVAPIQPAAAEQPAEAVV